MTFKHLAGLAGAVATVAVLTSSVGATPNPARRAVDLSTNGAVKSYLRSLGISPRGVVIQRGVRNYAGPRCPGKGWNCTRSRRVVQIATGGRAGAAAGHGWLSTSPHTNVATCLRVFGSNQLCVVVQSAGTGVSNSAVIGEVIGQTGQTLLGKQDAQVTQLSTNGSNSVQLAQTIGQLSLTLAHSVSQSQTSNQNFSISQTSSTGGSQTIKVIQLSAQVEAAQLATSGTQSADGFLVGHFTQSSSGLSTAKISQVHNPTLSARGGPSLQQTVHDPIKCCANQETNANDTINLTQSGTVKTKGDSEPDISAILEADCSSSGSCTVTQTQNTNGDTSTFTSTGSTVSSTVNCTAGSPCTQVEGEIVFDGSPGSGSPPASLGPYEMTPFGSDPQALGIVSGAGTIGFTPSLRHDRVGSENCSETACWVTWSNEYTGDVYDTIFAGDPTQATITLPAGTKAFYFYAEPQEFATFSVEATAQDGTTSGPIAVDGLGGARYFGFYGTGSATLSSISVTTADPTGFAVGEFGINAVEIG